ncbi:PREDICTED: uncharacterized protein LOC105586902 [Cercocebus atys]|uniref:uncharacterized protein LOC105586902 n=1 Tax=Cercocebus atys TaxID=9531 RepID=UPI0005F46ACA|nr:PREDICTED: uncharacterized protein LOC105586902 [Cercocebus atys]
MLNWALHRLMTVIRPVWPRGVPEQRTVSSGTQEAGQPAREAEGGSRAGSSTRKRKRVSPASLAHNSWSSRGRPSRPLSSESGGVGGRHLRSGREGSLESWKYLGRAERQRTQEDTREITCLDWKLPECQVNITRIPQRRSPSYKSWDIEFSPPKLALDLEGLALNWRRACHTLPVLFLYAQSMFHSSGALVKSRAHLRTVQQP